MKTPTLFFPALLVWTLCLPAPVNAELQLTEIATLPEVTDITHAGDGSQRLFVSIKDATIHIIRNGQLLATPFLDISDRVRSSGRELGLLSVAFSPQYAENGRFYVHYTNATATATVLSRFRVSADPDRADPNSEEILLEVPQPRLTHNGGRLIFDQNGLLYLSLGDGGGSGDPDENAQNTTNLLGTIIRLDVSQDSGFSIPSSNPFVGNADARDEIWAYGLRNPWRISFDSMTGDMFIGDVGQGRFEEINLIAAGSSGGLNFGWDLVEGTGGEAGFTDPILAYGHDNGDCSVTGGQVYRGPDYPNWLGRYLYGDYCSGRVWALTNTGGAWQNELLLDSGVIANLTTFGEDERGNLYLAATRDGVDRIFALSDGPAGEVEGIAIDGTLSGTYVVDGLNDQGFFVTVGENQSGTFLFVAWFTFDENGAPRWLVGVDFYQPGATELTLTLQEVSGLPFLDFSDNTASRSTFGSMRFRAVECGVIAADYDFVSGASGSLTLNKLTNIQGRDCAAAAR